MDKKEVLIEVKDLKKPILKYRSEALWALSFLQLSFPISL